MPVARNQPDPGRVAADHQPKAVVLDFVQAALRSSDQHWRAEAMAAKYLKRTSVRDEGVAGSNPATPTITYLKIQRSPAPIAAPFFSTQNVRGTKDQWGQVACPKESAELAGLSANERFPTIGLGSGWEAVEGIQRASFDKSTPAPADRKRRGSSPSLLYHILTSLADDLVCPGQSLGIDNDFPVMLRLASAYPSDAQRSL
jgi:hypothetical protein